ncbi:hypothetical protein L1049_002540 [Liquidambar formosana]|uniref:Uncharacterized protein n=1 Tax=Liquidambar formosana TaxID=63359 RepID=A0AAP0NJX3_LIQFO
MKNKCKSTTPSSSQQPKNIKKSTGEGKYYLVDAEFANMPNFLTPYCGVRYHLNGFQGGNHPFNAEEMFNHRYSQCD